MKTKLIKYDSQGKYIGEEEIEVPNTPEPEHEPTSEERIEILEALVSDLTDLLSE